LLNPLVPLQPWCHHSLGNHAHQKIHEEHPMAKPLFDAEALIAQFESATAKQGAQLRKATADATMAALQGRELTLKNIRGSLKQVAEAASAGIGKNLNTGVDAEALLDKAVAGIDDALLQAVEANRVALSTLTAQGADLKDKHLSKALSELEQMEDDFVSALKKTAADAGAPMASAWGPVLEKFQAGGSVAGAQATQTAEQLVDQMQSAVRQTRAASIKAAQALAESYTAMVSGVMLGMADALDSSKKRK
jgi:hypothetical protein